MGKGTGRAGIGTGSANSSNEIIRREVFGRSKGLQGAFRKVS